jgi:hypothetical protein
MIINFDYDKLKYCYENKKTSVKISKMIKTTKLQNYKTTKLQNYKTTKLQNYKTTKLQN